MLNSVLDYKVDRIGVFFIVDDSMFYFKYFAQDVSKWTEFWFLIQRNYQTWNYGHYAGFRQKKLVNLISIFGGEWIMEQRVWNRCIRSELAELAFPYLSQRRSLERFFFGRWSRGANERSADLKFNGSQNRSRNTFPKTKRTHAGNLIERLEINQRSLILDHRKQQRRRHRSANGGLTRRNRLKQPHPLRSAFRLRLLRISSTAAATYPNSARVSEL